MYIVNIFKKRFNIMDKKYFFWNDAVLWQANCIIMRSVDII